MRKIFLTLSVILLFSGWGAVMAYAQEKAEADYVVLKDSIAVSVDMNGSGTFAVAKTIQINTVEGGVENRIIKYDYDPLTAFAQFKFVKVLRADGKVENLDVKKALDYTAPARSIYWGARQIMIEVGRLNPGDVLQYEIAKKGFTYALLTGFDEIGDGSTYINTLSINSLVESADGDESRFIPPMRGQFYDIVPFWSEVPVERKVYRLSIPMEKEIQFQFYQGDCSSSMRYEGGRKVYTFAVNDVKPLKHEPNMVDPYDCAPKLMLSSTPKWQDKSLWFNKVNEDYGSFDAYAPAQKKVDELIKGKTTEIEKIAVLTHWVADNIRYAGISMGKGEGYTLHNAEMNFTDRCGVCKDIASTLIGFLRMAGFEAYPAMTMAGSRVESIPADHFNHCVAVVKLSTGVYMPLDPTWVPFCRELWSSAEQQQNYLPGVPEGSDLCVTPVSAPENHYVRIDAVNNIDAAGTLRGTFTISAEGQSDSRVRRPFTRMWMTQWKSALERELLAVSPKAKLISVDYGKDPVNYQAAPIKITYRYEIPGYALMADGGTLLLRPMTMNGLYSSVKTYLRINTSLEEREYGFEDGCSRLVDIHETITLPKGYKLLSDAKSDSCSSEAATFEGSLQQSGAAVELTQKLALYKRVYESSDWEGFREAVQMHKGFGDFIVIGK